MTGELGGLAEGERRGKSVDIRRVNLRFGISSEGGRAVSSGEHGVGECGGELEDAFTVGSLDEEDTDRPSSIPGRSEWIAYEKRP
jgi:hypothetical protein